MTVDRLYAECIYPSRFIHDQAQDETDLCIAINHVLADPIRAAVSNHGAPRWCRRIFLRQVGLSDLTNPEEVNAIILAEEGAVVAFVSRAYEVSAAQTPPTKVLKRLRFPRGDQFLVFCLPQHVE